MFLDVASSIAGQRADLLASAVADPAEVTRTVLSEMFHNIIQAAGRGACRTTVNGSAEAMTLTLLCVETFPATWWQQAMPGVRVIEEKPGELARAAAQSSAHKALTDALAKLPTSDAEVSSRTLNGPAPLSWTGSIPNAFRLFVSR